MGMLSHYSSGIDGLWGKITSSGFDKFVSASKLKSKTEAQVFKNLLSRASVCKDDFDATFWTNCLGIFKYTNGDTYVGEWKNGKVNGQGAYTWPNGDKYVGEFKDGKLHGQGTHTQNDGTVLRGLWVDGKSKKIAKSKTEIEFEKASLWEGTSRCIASGGYVHPKMIKIQKVSDRKFKMWMTNQYQLDEGMVGRPTVFVKKYDKYYSENSSYRYSDWVFNDTYTKLTGNTGPANIIGRIATLGANTCKHAYIKIN